ncbi:MAG TPA: response regulator [Tepidisphaeraceae bacterium]|jgi:two-component system OmpR family response regulator
MATILVVDDEQRIRDLLRNVLAGQGHKICVASNGSEALMALEVSRPDLVLLDVAMPEMDGIQFLRVLRESPEWANTPVILLTAFATPQQHSDADGLGVCGQLTKASFSVRELRARIAGYLAQTGSGNAAVC